MTISLRRWRSALLGGLFLVAFVPRAVYPISRPLQWYERSFRFVDAVLHGQWADTLVSEHPGVAAMWLIGLAQHGYAALRRAWGEPSYSFRAVDRAFRAEVFVSVLPLALVIALGVLLAWWLLKRLFGEPVAWAGAGFLALDPFHIAISKVVHVDALLSVLMLLSALTLLLYLRHSRTGEHPHSFWPRYRLLLTSGALGGLAFLTKSPAYFLAPFLGLSLLVTHRRARLVRDYLVPGVLWVGSAAVVYVALWPAMWVEPAHTLATVFGGVLKHAERAHPQPLCFLGKLTTEDPGVGYYLLSLLVKTTALSLPLFIIGLFSPLVAGWRHDRKSLGLLVAYFLFFFVQMSLGAKKAPRYLLPAFPAFSVIAGVGLVTLARRLASLEAKIVPELLVAVALALQAALVLPYHPYYIAQASLLVGGPSGAQHILLTTPEGEGLDMAAGYLNGLPHADQLRVGVQLPAREAFSQYFEGEVVDTREPDLDYLVFANVYVTRHMAEDQWGDQWERYKYRVPEYTAYLHGLPYAWVYRVDEGPQPPALPQRVCLGEHIQLLGCTSLVDGTLLGERPAHPGDPLRLTLHWAATGTPEGDYSVFVHLLGPDGTLVAQQDNVPQGGTYPTFLWKPGERLDDTYEVVIPPGAPAGSYQLVAGMYDWRTGERLTALADCAASLPENQVHLVTFEVRSKRLAWWQVLAWVLAGILALGGLILERPDLTSALDWLGRWRAPLLYVLLTLAMTYPAVAHLGDQVFSSGPDAWVFWWNNWWVKKALATGQNVTFTRYLFFPFGVDLTYHSFSWLNTALWLLLEPLVGSVVAYNLSVLWVFPLAGWGMECLVRDLTGSKGAAFLAGLIYAFVPYRLGQYNHPNLIGTQWLPWYTMYLLRAFRGGRRRAILPASGFLMLTALVGWNLFLYLIIWMAVIGGYLWLARVSTLRRLLGVIGGTLLVGCVVLSPLLAPLLTRGVGSQEALGDVQQDWMQSDLLVYVLPNQFHPLWGRAVEPVYQRLGKPRRVVYVGYAVMALLGYGLLRRQVRRQTGLWWCGALLWWVMALGPFLKFNGHIYRDIPLPYYPLSRLYAFKMLKIPDRYNLMLSLPVSVLVGYATADLLARMKGRWRTGVLATLSVLILFEYLSVPVVMQPLDVPAFYARLAGEAGEFGIVELPVDFYDSSKRYMLYQTVHGHPIVEGHVSRRPPEATAFLDAQPLLCGLYQDQEIDPALTDVSRQLRALRDAGFRYIIIHKRLTDARRVADWQSWLTFMPVFEDDEIVVYSTRPRYGKDFEFLGELGDGIGVVRASFSTTTLSQAGRLDVELAWGTRQAPGRDRLARLALVSQVGTEAAWVDVEPCEEWPTSQWGPDEIARGRGVLRLSPLIEGGTYTVTVRLVDPGSGAPVGQSLNLGRVEVRAVEG